VTAAVNHLRDQLDNFVPNLAQFSIRNVDAKDGLWEFGINDQTVRGTTDIIIAPGDAVKDPVGLAPEILACFEFQDPTGAPGPLVVTDQTIRQLKVVLMAACVTSSRPLICFVTDLTSGARAVHIAERNGEFDIIQTDLTLDQLGCVLAALLRPQYHTVMYTPPPEVEAAPGAVRNATLFKRKFEETYESSDDAFDMLEDLLEDGSLPKHLQLQAVREYLASAGLHSSLLEVQEAFYRDRERGQHEGDIYAFE
jgi:hypothetical protein